jgi:AcrR family transcriptional regulator
VSEAAGRLHRLEDELKGARQELIERVRAAADEGVPLARIAREADVSRPTVYEWLKRPGSS